MERLEKIAEIVRGVKELRKNILGERNVSDEDYIKYACQIVDVSLDEKEFEQIVNSLKDSPPL